MDSLVSIFGKRWGCEKTIETVESPALNKYAVKVNSGLSDTSSFDGSIKSLKLRFNGRWGNYVLQLINMCHIAEKLGAERIYACSTEIFLLESVTINDIVFDDVTNSTCERDFQLEGVFFDIESFGALADGLDANRRHELALKYVRPLMAPLRQNSDLIGPNDLVVHIRSGDIFQGEEGAGGSALGGFFYVQPPLAFYTIIAAAVAQSGIEHVVIISEDSLNPTIFPLVEALQKAKFAVSVRLNHDLNSDLNCMLAARRVVFANGTIGIAVALLSTAIAHGFFFRKEATGSVRNVDYFLGDHLIKHFVIDDDEGYIRKGEWKNNQEQRSLMLTFPETALRFETPRVPKNVATKDPI
jgi:hypothetical protein